MIDTLQSSLKDSRGVLFLSPKGSSEYAEVGNRIVYKLCEQNIAVSWNQLSIDSLNNDETDIVFQCSKKTINKKIEFDTAIFCCSPDVWTFHIEKYKIKFVNKKKIGYFSWETNKLPSSWVNYCNLMDEIWVPSKFNKDILELCGVDVPVKVIPYPFIEQNLLEVNDQTIEKLRSISKWYSNKKEQCDYGSVYKTFYTIGEWSDKTNIEGVLKSFCKSFTSKDNVNLIIKTSHTDYSTENVDWCVNRVESLLEEFPDYPDISLITENITSHDLLLIHSVGECFVSLSKGEGFCLEAWDAFNYKKDIVITGYGGHRDYLGENHKWYVGFKLVNVTYKDKETIYNSDQKWADPSIEDCVEKLRSLHDRKLSVEHSDDVLKSKSECLNNRNAISFSQLTAGRKLLKSKITQLVVKNESEFKGITYIGQYGTSGYATAAKGNLVHFFLKGIPVSWIPLYFDNSQLSDECFYNSMAKSLIEKPIENCDTVIFHCTPDLWPEMRNRYRSLIKDKRVIGYTVWETNKLPYLWVESINDSVDEVWCPSSYNKTVFEDSGIIIPIKVFPHVFLPKKLPAKESVSMKFLDGESVIGEDSYYTFYNISELNPRKGVEDLVRTFCQTFSSKDKVRLILKTHYKNYEDKNKKHCIDVLNEITSSCDDPPKIHILLNNLTEREILGLHSIGDCYVSLCKSEGFGLTIFEAFKYGKKVIVTGYGGHIDFLGKAYQGLVKYKMGPITDMEGFSKIYSCKQEWAYPDSEHAKMLMKGVLQ